MSHLGSKQTLKEDEVLTTHLLREDVDRAEAELTEEQVYRRDLDWLSCCDVLIAEASGSSHEVGFEVGYVIGHAREKGQRVLLVYDAARRDAVSRLISGNCDEACTTFAYRSIEDLTAFIDRHTGPPFRLRRCRWVGGRGIACRHSEAHSPMLFARTLFGRRLR